MGIHIRHPLIAILFLNTKFHNRNIDRIFLKMPLNPFQCCKQAVKIASMMNVWLIFENLSNFIRLGFHCLCILRVVFISMKWVRLVFYNMRNYVFCCCCRHHHILLRLFNIWYWPSEFVLSYCGDFISFCCYVYWMKCGVLTNDTIVKF